MATTCGLPVNGAMASAINALDDIHGGAGQQCMALYREVAAEGDDPAAAAEVVLARWRAAGTKYLPGFGHRFHRGSHRGGYGGRQSNDHREHFRGNGNFRGEDDLSGSLPRRPTTALAGRTD